MKYYGIYDLKDNGTCVGIFTLHEAAAYFGLKPNQMTDIFSKMRRGYMLTFHGCEMIEIIDDSLTDEDIMQLWEEGNISIYMATKEYNALHNSKITGREFVKLALKHGYNRQRYEWKLFREQEEEAKRCST